MNLSEKLLVLMDLEEEGAKHSVRPEDYHKWPSWKRAAYDHKLRGNELVK